jgi:hypothetical protein
MFEIGRYTIAFESMTLAKAIERLGYYINEHGVTIDIEAGVTLTLTQHNLWRAEAKRLH